MAIKVQINPTEFSPEHDHAVFAFDPDDLVAMVINPGRGQWQCTDADDGAGRAFTGFDCENLLTLHVAAMHDGSWNVVVVAETVDSPLVVATAEGQGSFDGKAMGAAAVDLMNRLANRHPVVKVGG